MSASKWITESFFSANNLSRYFPGFKVQLLCSIDINNIYDGSDNSQPTSTYLKWKRFKHQKFCIENILNKDKADGNTGFDFTI